MHPDVWDSRISAYCAAFLRRGADGRRLSAGCFSSLGGAPDYELLHAERIGRRVARRREVAGRSVVKLARLMGRGFRPNACDKGRFYARITAKARAQLRAPIDMGRDRHRAQRRRRRPSLLHKGGRGGPDFPGGERGVRVIAGCRQGYPKGRRSLLGGDIAGG